MTLQNPQTASLILIFPLWMTDFFHILYLLLLSFIFTYTQIQFQSTFYHVPIYLGIEHISTDRNWNINPFLDGCQKIYRVLVVSQTPYKVKEKNIHIKKYLLYQSTVTTNLWMLRFLLNSELNTILFFYNWFFIIITKYKKGISEKSINHQSNFLFLQQIPLFFKTLFYLLSAWIFFVLIFLTIRRRTLFHKNSKEIYVKW